jgi:four helix bundle protein
MHYSHLTGASMYADNFEDLIVWKKSIQLYKDIYSIRIERKDWHYRDQLHRATLSISNNIAEGFDAGYNKEFARFLLIAKRSCAEVRSMLHVANELGLMTNQDVNALIAECRHISIMLHKLHKSLLPS